MRFGNINRLIIGLSVVIAAWILAAAWTRSHSGNATINVTGLASRNFTSDLIVWEATFNRKAPTIQEAYAMLKTDNRDLRMYMTEKGIKEKDLVFSAVSISKEFEYVRDKNDMERQIFKGYKLSQRIQIESKEVEKIEELSRQVTELIDKGIELYSQEPQYYYTRLSELKIEMLAQATADARLRASKIAENANSSLGDLKFAEMGIFQITAQNSNEDYSWGGAFNTSSKAKTASITIRLQFHIH